MCNFLCVNRATVNLLIIEKETQDINNLLANFSLENFAFSYL